MKVEAKATVIPRETFSRAIQEMIQIMVDMVADNEVPVKYQKRIKAMMEEYVGSVTYEYKDPEECHCWRKRDKTKDKDVRIEGGD